MVRFAERLGTSGADSLEGITGAITFGLGGNDTLTARSGSAFNILTGGTGSDTYRSRAGTAITIADGGSSAGDTLITSSLGPSQMGFTALIDGRHFAAFNPDTGETVYVLDFLSSANYIERIVTPDGTYTTNELYNFARSQPTFQGNVKWEDLPKLGFVQPYTTGEINEAISFYSQKAAALEVNIPAGDDGSIYRFFNAKTGAHFYTASLDERNFVSRNLFDYKYEGNAFDTDATAANGSAVFRFYNTKTGVHFYTISEAERDNVMRTLPQFVYEGEAYKAYTTDGAGRQELHRFYNTDTGTHFYTASDAEQQQVVKTLPQYRYEGVAYYVDAA